MFLAHPGGFDQSRLGGLAAVDCTIWRSNVQALGEGRSGLARFLRLGVNTMDNHLAPLSAELLSQGGWQMFSPDTNPEDARRSFRRRYGQEPAHVRLDTRWRYVSIKAGPVPEMKGCTEVQL
jgi:hypothetical protein